MPSTLDRRLDRVEAALGGSDDDRLIYAKDDESAAKAWNEAIAKDGHGPLILVCGQDGLGPTIRELLDDIAKNGRRIHDPRPEGYRMPTYEEYHIYYPPEPRRRHAL